MIATTRLIIGNIIKILTKHQTNSSKEDMFTKSYESQSLNISNLLAIPFWQLLFTTFQIPAVTNRFKENKKKNIPPFN
jgi:hypothetical protein